MSGMPSLAECRALLADGSVLTVTATRRAREGRADVKCSVPGQSALAERMQQVVRLARHTELRVDSREQVMLSVDRAPAANERGWELAAVLADRMVRALLPVKAGLAANGWSDEWHLGRINGHTLRGAHGDVLLGGADGLPHLGALAGRPDLSGAVSSARAWFPLHSAGACDSLCWVEVSVFPLQEAGADEEAAIAVPGQDAAVQHAVRRALVDARHFDGRGGAWRTTVRFAEPRFQGNSFELALVMADRIARGREFLPRGRILASGCSGAWHAGRVDPVEAIGPKCALILREAAQGDRVLLPRASQAQVPAGFAAQLRERGASLACVERIGIL
jgi:hypothetical protein